MPKETNNNEIVHLKALLDKTIHENELLKSQTLGIGRSLTESLDAPSKSNAFIVFGSSIDILLFIWIYFKILDEG